MIRILRITPRTVIARFALLFAAVVVSFVLALMASAQAAHFGGVQSTVTSGIPATGVAFDASGNLYISATNGSIYKETPSGSGYTQTTLFTTQYTPTAIALDSTGNLFMATSSGGVLKYTYSGGTFTSVTLIVSGLSLPAGLAVDNVGNVYVSDSVRSTIYKLVPAGGPYNEVPIITGLEEPEGIALDSNDDLFIADYGPGRIVEATLSNGSYSTAFVGPTVTHPYGLAVDASGDLIVTTATSLYFEPLVNGGYNQTLLASNFGQAMDVVLDGRGGMYVADSGNDDVVKQTLSPSFGSSPVGTATATQTMTFVFDTGGALSSSVPVEALTLGVDNLDYTFGGAGSCTGGTTFSAGQTCTVIGKFKPAFSGTRDGAFVLNGSSGNRVATAYVTGIGTGPQLVFPPTQSTPVSDLDGPQGVAVDAGGNLYIADSGGSQLLKETLVDGSYTQSVVGSNFRSPTDVAVDGAGNLYIADSLAEAVYKESLSEGTYTQSTLFYSNTISPHGVTVDGYGNVYFTDTLGGNIYKARPVGSAYNTAIIVGGVLSNGIAVDSNSNVYFEDDTAGNIYEATPSGGTYNPTLILGGFTNPLGLTIDGNNNLYVADNSTGQVARATLGNGAYTQTPVASVTNPVGLAINGNSLYVVTVHDSNTASAQNAVLLENLGNPATLMFASTPVGQTSADSPELVTVENVGNQPLVLTQPGSGLNPNVGGPNFSLNQTATTCPIASSAGSASIPAETPCSYAFTFTPTVPGNPHVYAIFTDNNLDANATQQMNLTGPSARGPQTITFPQPPSPLVYSAGQTAVLNATTSSGLAVSYQISGPVTITTSAGVSTLHYTGVGTVTVTALQNGNGDYLAATPVSVTIQLVSAPPSDSYTAPTTEIRTPTAPQTVTLLVTAAGTTNSTLASGVKVLTQGAPNLDFGYVSGGTCAAATAYVVNETCTVDVVFSPLYAGPRYGAVVLADANGNPLATSYIQGTGLGPQAVLSPVQTQFGSFTTATAIAVDGAGNVYVADAGTNQVVEEVSVNNSVYTQSPTPVATGLNGPYGVAVDGAGNVFVADSGNGQVLEEINTNGSYTPAAAPVVTGLNSPNGLALDGAGNLYIAVGGANKVIKETLTNGVYNTQSPTTVATGLNDPHGVAVDGTGNVYIANYVGGSNPNLAGTILKVPYSGGVYSSTPVSIGNNNLATPTGVAVDGDGNVYAVDAIDYYSGAIKLTYANGTYTTSNFGSGLNAPSAIAIDGAGNIYIADAGNDRALLENVNESILTFPSTPFSVADAPMAITLSNIGSDPLTFAVPNSGTNPQTGSDFALESNSDTTCPTEKAGGSAGTLAANASCTLSYVFTPAAVGTEYALSTITDNTMNIPGAEQVIQIIGTSTQGSQTITFPSFGNVGTYVSGISFPLSATSSSGLPVTYTTSAMGGLISTITGTASNPAVTITGTGQGTVIVSANQAGNADYAAAPQVSQSINITIIATAPASGSGFLDTQIGQSATATVNIFLTADGQTGQVQALLQGAPGLDYSASLPNSGCSAGSNVLAGQSCTVSVTFTPRYAGPRYGAVNLLDTSGNILGTAYVHGNGLGPQIAFRPAQSTLGSGLNQAEGIAVDGAGNLFVADTYNNRVVEEVLSNGVYTQSPSPIGSGFNQPTGVAVDGAGNLYVTDNNNRVVKEVLSGGVYTQSPINIGTGLKYPQGVAVDQAGNLYIADTYNNRVVVVNFSGGVYTQSSTPIGTGLALPFRVALDSVGNVYIADSVNDRLLKETYSGGTYTQTPIAMSGIYSPVGLALDAAGNVYVADPAENVVIKEVFSGGVYTQSPMHIGNGLNNPYGLAVDSAGNVYIANSGSSNILVETVTQAPTLSFPSTATGVTSAPVATTVTNLGNVPLTFPVPGSGMDPATSTNFSLETNSDTTCPVVNAGGTAGTLGAHTSCTLSYVFTPTVVSATVAGTSVLTDNNLNVTGATQTINLTGVSTQGTQATQTITFPQPAGAVYPGAATLTATASSGLAVTYTVNSGPATISGSTLTYTGPGAVSVTASQAGNVSVAAAVPVTITINVSLGQAAVGWIPATLKVYTGTSLNGVLDASDSIPSTISYTAYLLPSGAPFAVTSSTVLQQGNYGLTATVTPNDTVHFATTSVTLLFSVQNMNIFVANMTGSVTPLYNNGTQQSAAVAGGGIGSAADSSGNVWSINSNGNGVSRFTDSGSLSANLNGVAGINAATALAVDGNGLVWIANGNGTISSLTNAGTANTTTPIGSAAGLNAPASVSVDAAGSLWIANSGNNTVTEIIGVAAPVTTPTSQAVFNNTVATQP